MSHRNLFVVISESDVQDEALSVLHTSKESAQLSAVALATKHTAKKFYPCRVESVYQYNEGRLNYKSYVDAAKPKKSLLRRIFGSKD